MKKVIAAIAVLASLAVCGTVGACDSQLAWQPPAPAMPRPASTAGVPASTAAGNRLLAGVYEQGLPDDWTLVRRFTGLTSVKPKIVVYYSGWYEKFHAETARLARAEGGYVLVQLEPGKASPESIAQGNSDAYLYSYAEAVRNFGYPVILSFAHEMNGNWYSWGAGHASPGTLVAAWRHVVTVFRTVGATNVTWLWTVNSTNAASSDLSKWWPGAAWVNWVGIDGYYYRPSDTFGSVFGQTLARIRRFTKDPVLISEAGVGVTPDRESQIASLFEGAHADHLLGIVWFDQAQHNGIFHQDWRLEDDPAALAKYKAEARRYEAAQ